MRHRQRAQRDQSVRLALPADQCQRASQWRRSQQRGWHVPPERAEERSRSQRALHAAEPAGQALAGIGLDVVGGWGGRGRGARHGGNRAGDRMVRGLRQRSRHAQDFRVAGAFCLHADGMQRIRRQRTGLVEGDTLEPCQPFQHVAAAHEHAALRRQSDRQCMCERGGQAQRARARHHQHGQSGQHRGIRRLRRSACPAAPEPRAGRGQRQHAGDEHGNDAVDGVARQRFARQRFTHLPAGLLPPGLRAGCRGTDQQRAAAVDAAGVHQRARRLELRLALPGQDSFVALRAAIDDDAVDWHALAGKDPHPLARPDVDDGAPLLRAAIDHARLGAFSRQHWREAAHGAHTHLRLKQAAQRKQQQHHGGGVEIDQARTAQYLPT
ncbi:hypothetical protein D9M68_378340 [compost metagenome]